MVEVDFYSEVINISTSNNNNTLVG